MDAIILGTAIGGGYAWLKLAQRAKKRRKATLTVLRNAALTLYGAPPHKDAEVALATIASRTVWALFGIGSSRQFIDAPSSMKAAMAYALCVIAGPLAHVLKLNPRRTVLRGAALFTVDNISGEAARLFAPQLLAKTSAPADLSKITGIEPLFFVRLQDTYSAFEATYAQSNRKNRELGTWISAKTAGFSDQLAAALLGRANALEFAAQGCAEHWSQQVVEMAFKSLEA